MCNVLTSAQGRQKNIQGPGAIYGICLYPAQKLSLAVSSKVLDIHRQSLSPSLPLSVNAGFLGARVRGSAQRCKDRLPEMTSPGRFLLILPPALLLASHDHNYSTKVRHLAIEWITVPESTCYRKLFDRKCLTFVLSIGGKRFANAMRSLIQSVGQSGGQR